MENLIKSIEQGIPIIIIVALTLFMSLEAIIPFISPSEYRKKQRWHNIGNLALIFVFNAALSGVVTYSITTASKNEFGLLYHLPLPFFMTLVLGVMLSDLNGYLAHRLYHVIPLFWRFHRVHHSDIELDASSALRMHPFEFIFQAATQATVLPLLGVSNTAFVIYIAFSLPLFIINHANIKFPVWYEKYVSLIFITPEWHRVHHSSYQPETDSNFADVFTIWDRLFFTHKSKKSTEIKYGLETLRNKSDQTFWGMLITPFRPVK